MSKLASTPWALDDSKVPETTHHHKNANSKAAQSSAKAVIFSDYGSQQVDPVATGKRMNFGHDGVSCPFAVDEVEPPQPRTSETRRKAQRGDVGDRYAVGSDKVGSVPLGSEVYSANLAASRARMVSARAAAAKGAGGFTDA